MTSADFEAALKAAGLPGAIMALFFWLAVKTNIFSRDDKDRPPRTEVIDQLKSLRQESAEESRLTRAELAKLKDEMKDRLARIETRQEDHSRRIDRLDAR